jgi:hypothetical protein
MYVVGKYALNCAGTYHINGSYNYEENNQQNALI